MTNYHVITKDILINNKNIEIKLNNKNIKISIHLYRRIWTNKEIDFTCIEILKEDNIIEKLNPFEIDDNCYYSNFNTEEYDKRSIVIPSMKIIEEIELSQGIIYYLKNEKYKQFFFHNCNTEPGFSGGPIILINNIKIMGIHKGYEKNNKKNIGIYFKEIMALLSKSNQLELPKDYKPPPSYPPTSSTLKKVRKKKKLEDKNKKVKLPENKKIEIPKKQDLKRNL